MFLQIKGTLLLDLAREDLPLVKLPLHWALPEAAAPKEETASSCLSLEEEIEQFHLEEEEEQGAQVIPISDANDEVDRLSSVCTPVLIITRPDSSSEEEEEEMALNQRKGLRDLMAGRNKGSRSKKIPKSHVPSNLPPPLLLPQLNLACSPFLT